MNEWHAQMLICTAGTGYVGPQRLELSCSTSASRWCICHPDGTLTVVDTNTDSALSIPDRRILEISDLRPDLEGEYKCENSRTTFETTRCVFAIGKQNVNMYQKLQV